MSSHVTRALFRLRAKPLVGRAFGGWRLERLIGAGSFGASFLARRADGTEAVLKLVRPLRPDEADALLMLDPEDARREAGEIPAHATVWTECAALQRCEGSPLIPQWIGIVNESGRYFIALTRQPGTSLARLLHERHVFSDREIGLIARDLGAALAHAHARGVAHNDVRPANALFDGAHASLIDFGLATFFPPQNARADFAASSLIDRSGLADTLLFLLYTRYRGPRSENTWSEELSLLPEQRTCLEGLFADNPPWTSWTDIEAAIAAAFPVR